MLNRTCLSWAVPCVAWLLGPVPHVLSLVPEQAGARVIQVSAQGSDRRLSSTTKAAAGPRQAGAKPRTKVWEQAIRAFEQQDLQQPPAPGRILFVGSSTIRMWKTDKSFPDLPVINRGFGGSMYSDVLQYADRIVLPYKPTTIVLYAGDNDIAGGKTPEQVLADVRALVQKIRKGLPETRIIILSVKLSTARWKLRDKMLKLNALMQDLAKGDSRTRYVELGTQLLDAEGKPQPDLFLKDGLHLSEKGYAMWAATLTPILKAE
jgi:lysophospholipase L1-like esterase